MATVRVTDYRLRPGDTPDRALTLLRQAATKAFPTADLADLWMRATNPRLDRRRPVEVCVNPEGLEQCIRALQKPVSASRSRHLSEARAREEQSAKYRFGG
jgi:hypothetical protein